MNDTRTIHLKWGTISRRGNRSRLHVAGFVDRGVSFGAYASRENRQTGPWKATVFRTENMGAIEMILDTEADSLDQAKDMCTVAILNAE